jgi:hypothetical protein
MRGLPLFMARHPTDGATFKIVWAHHHLDELKRHIGLYFDNTPYAVPSYRKGNLVIVHTPKLYAPPHLDIGGIIGDCLCAMMASLDYIMWELVSKYIGRPLVPPHLGGRDAPSFPLYKTLALWQKADFATNRAPHFKFPAAVVDEITAVQPYNAGYEPLWLLYVLVNQDKHRLPLLCEAQVKTGDLSVSFGGQVATVVHSAAQSMAVQAPPGPLPIGGQHQMEVKANVLAKFIAFDDPTMPREPVEVTLENILRCVERILGRFEPFFL